MSNYRSIHAQTIIALVFHVPGYQGIHIIVFNCARSPEHLCNTKHNNPRASSCTGKPNNVSLLSLPQIFWMSSRFSKAKDSVRSVYHTKTHCTATIPSLRGWTSFSTSASNATYAAIFLVGRGVACSDTHQAVVLPHIAHPKKKPSSNPKP